MRREEAPARFAHSDSAIPLQMGMWPRRDSREGREMTGQLSWISPQSYFTDVMPHGNGS